MRRPHWLLVPGFLAGQALGVWLIAGSEHPPAPPDLGRFPSQVGEWSSAGDDPTAAEVLATSQADRLLSRFYIRPPAGAVANLLVAWYQSQRGGDRQPHQPTICLQSAGWTTVSQREIEIGTAAGAIRVSSYVVSRHRERTAILYWYQSPRRVVAGEWACKFWLAVDAARDHRTDGALVRICVPATGGRDDRAIEETVAFARSLYPLLRTWLPR